MVLVGKSLVHGTYEHLCTTVHKSKILYVGSKTCKTLSKLKKEGKSVWAQKYYEKGFW